MTNCKVCKKTIRQKKGPGRPRTTHEACKGKKSRKTTRKKTRKTGKKTGKKKVAKKQSRKVSRSLGSAMVQCVFDDKGKLRVLPITTGVKRQFVQFPKDLRVPGARYWVSQLIDTGRGFYRVAGNILPE